MNHIRNDGHALKPELFIQPNIGLDNDARHSVVEILNHTLAFETVLAVKTRGAFWNMSGASFLELHYLFESQYEQLNHFSDEIAERVRMLGGVALGSLQEFIHYTKVEEQPGVIPDLLRLIADHETTIRSLREDARKCNDEFEDEGTYDLLIKMMRVHEKMAWILRSQIEPELFRDESRE